MNIETLKYFNAVVTYKSISKVANDSHISQSALSQKLYKLEESLGITALKRSNKGVELTSQGELLYNYSKKIVKMFDTLENDLHNLKDEKNNLTIETSELSGSYILPQILNKASAKFDNFSYNILCKYNTDIYSDLINNICDITIGINNSNDTNLKSIHLGDDELICVSRESLVSNLNEIPFLVLEDEHNIENIISNYINLDNVIIRSNSLHTIITYLTTTRSIAVLPKLCIADELNSGILKEVVLPNFKNNKYSLYLTHRTDINKSYKDKVSFISRNMKAILTKK